MVPQHFVELDAIPLLPNGKIDRKALPKPLDIGATSAYAFQAPESDAEIAFAEIWQQLLGVERVSADDNFFDLGGHSLLVMRAVVAIEKRTGLRISPRRFIFEELRQLASGAGGQDGAKSQPEREAPKKGLLRRLKDAIF
jgi:acyl carrier protein